MSIRTTVTLDDDVYARLKQESERRGEAFSRTLNEILRLGLLRPEPAPKGLFQIQAKPLGWKKGLDYDDIETLNRLVEKERTAVQEPARPRIRRESQSY